MLTLLTVTGCRPKPWALCEEWMRRQTYAGPVHWIVVDDGELAQPVTFDRPGWAMSMVRPQPFWKPGDNTQARNLLLGLALTGGEDKVLVIEDDDYYDPEWLSTCATALSAGMELVGESRARYYNLRSRVAHEHRNTEHASLCATAVTGRGVAALRRACQQNQSFIDIELWQANLHKGLFGGHRVVGMKGLPGRAGIGMGHDLKRFRGANDQDGSTLRAWVGADAARLYEGLV